MSIGEGAAAPFGVPCSPGTLKAKVAAAGGGPHLSCILTGDGVGVVLGRRSGNRDVLHCCPKNLSFADSLGQDR